MKTTKILKSFLVILFCVTAITASAQKEDWNELCIKNMQIEKEIQSLIADTTTLHQTITKFDAEQLRLNAQIDSIAALCDILKGDVDNKKLSAIQQKVDSLNAVVKKLQNRKNDLVFVNGKKATELSILKRNISGMGAYSAIKDEQLYTQYQEILSKPFSKITTEELGEIDSKLNSFTKLPNFTEFNIRFNACKRNKKIYDDAESILKKKYNADEIERTRDKLYELLYIKKNDLRKGIVKLSERQYSEIDTLDIKLSRYGDGIAVLQGIVKAINGSKVREENQGNKAKCLEAMRSIVISEAAEDAEKRQRYFGMIPSLNSLYQSYWCELQAEPFKYPTESETIIMQLKNE